MKTDSLFQHNKNYDKNLGPLASSFEDKHLSELAISNASPRNKYIKSIDFYRN